MTERLGQAPVGLDLLLDEGQLLLDTADGVGSGDETRGQCVTVRELDESAGELRGVAALLTMLNSCAPGVSVVNIDNGYGAGHLAAQIAEPADGHGA